MSFKKEGDDWVHLLTAMFVCSCWDEEGVDPLPHMVRSIKDSCWVTSSDALTLTVVFLGGFFYSLILVKNGETKRCSALIYKTTRLTSTGSLTGGCSKIHCYIRLVKDDERDK